MSFNFGVLLGYMYGGFGQQLFGYVGKAVYSEAALALYSVIYLLVTVRQLKDIKGTDED